MTVGPHDQVHGRNPQPSRLIWNLETPDVHGDFERLKAARRHGPGPTSPTRTLRAGSRPSRIPTTTTSSLVATFRASPPMDERQTRVSDLLHEAAETHHRVFRISDGADDDWASWYAQWLDTLSELPELLGAKVVRSTLVA